MQFVVGGVGTVDTGIEFGTASFIVGAVGTEGVDGDIAGDDGGTAADFHFVAGFNAEVDGVGGTPRVAPEFFQIGSRGV